MKPLAASTQDRWVSASSLSPGGADTAHISMFLSVGNRDENSILISQPATMTFCTASVFQRFKVNSSLREQMQARKLRTATPCSFCSRVLVSATAAHWADCWLLVNPVLWRGMCRLPWLHLQKGHLEKEEKPTVLSLYNVIKGLSAHRTWIR